MPESRNFRFLANRAELGFYRRPNRFRRRTWLAGGLLGALAVAWVALAVVRGQSSHFSAGPVSTAHHMFENDCAVCHTTWGPARRLVSLDVDTAAVSNDKCVVCHKGPPHQQRLVEAHPPIREILCAECHREHRHQKTLAEVTDAFCIACHADLTVSGHGDTERFAPRISSFEGTSESGSHPEFALQNLLQQSQPAQAQQPGARDVLEWFFREDDRGTPLGVERFQDRARIRFNHKLHLRPVDKHDQPLAGLADGQGLLRDLSQNCQTCHQLDPQGRYMLPIQYETHCRECHPLRFDDKAYPGESVPHAEPKVVRGFLMERYSRAALNQAPDRTAKADKSEDLFDLPYAPRLPMDVVEKVEQEVVEIERGLPQPFSAGNAEHRLFGPEARGGCRYCHDIVEPSPEKSPVELWKITQPRIPDRWMEHSRFRHRSHEFMKCRECHAGVDASFSTGDVLLPGIALCRNCHAPEAKWPSSEGTSQPRLNGARTHCVECHAYHNAALHGNQP